MKRIGYLFAAGLLACTTLALAETPGPPRQNATREFMRQKLIYAQNILEGLTLERYEQISTNAALLGNMNLTNTFTRLRNPYYTREVTEFQRSVDRLLKDAQRNELWPVYEDYNRVSQSCVSCHQKFRREQVVKHLVTRQD
jgi:hypothetical protein